MWWNLHKNPQCKDLKSFQVGEHVTAWGELYTETAWHLHTPSCVPHPMHLLTQLCICIFYYILYNQLVKVSVSGFPDGAVVENLPANAGDMGSSPGLGRSHMPRSNWAREPQLLSLRARNLCSATREAAIVRGPHTTMKSDPRLPQLEKTLAQKRKTQHS